MTEDEFKSEDDVQQGIQAEAPKHSAILMRNNSGAMTDATGRTVRYGLGHISKKQNEKFKSSDLIGITEVLITPEMVGTKLGVFTAVEVKEPNWKFKGTAREVAQRNFNDFIKSKFGFAGFAKDLTDFHKIIGK